jgi:hypothetical protein
MIDFHGGRRSESGALNSQVKTSSSREEGQRQASDSHGADPVRLSWGMGGPRIEHMFVPYG